MSETTLYERLGGRDGIRAVVDDFSGRLVADEQLRPFFAGSSLERLRRTQTDFLCEAVVGAVAAYEDELLEGPSE